LNLNYWVHGRVNIEIMECPLCEHEMELQESVTDYYDPGDPYGHGQFESKDWVCPYCGNTEDYIEADFIFEE